MKKIDVIPVFAPTQYLLYLLDNSSGVVVENRQQNFGNEEAKQLKALQQLLCK